MQGQHLLPVVSLAFSVSTALRGSVTDYLGALRQDRKHIRTGSPSSEPHLSQKARA